MPNLFPTIEVLPDSEVTENEQVKFGRSWKFDFNKGDFEQTPTGKVVEADGLEAYAQWCYKALFTARYKFVIYSRKFGNDFEELFKRKLTREAIESEIKRIVTETLMVDRRTSNVKEFSFEWKDDAIYYDCVITTTQGERLPISSYVNGAT